MKNQETKAVTVRIHSGNTDALKDANLYVFDSQGELLESVTLNKGEAALRTKAEQIGRKTQMIIGPVLPKEFSGKKLNPEMMKKMGGYQPAVHLNSDNVINITGLPKLPLLHWNWCLITGELSKTFTIDGRNQTLPVCDARVHICEIDRIRWRWPRIPVYVIDELGRKLKEVIINPKIKFPPIGPDPDPGFASGFIKKSEHRQIQTNSIAKRAISLPKLSLQLQEELLSESQMVVRESIYKNFHLLHPYLCHWPWFWPYFYTSHEIGTAYTDCNGRFNFEYFNFTNDKDIYIWAEVCINGQWVTVYRPSIPCHTKWNYACGTDINIRITDPRVLPCNCGQQLQGELVWFRSIGESATALHIEQEDTHTVNVQGADMLNVGCTDVTDAHCISPFGSTLNFKLLFGDGLPKAGVTHYRWRKTNLQDAALNNILSPGTTVVSGSVQKAYFVITTDANNHMHFETKFVTLGAEGAGENIGYRIPHWNIYLDPGVPAADKLLTIQWTSPDFWSASLDSNSLADGLWRFDLELLQQNDAGDFLVVEVPKQVFQVSAYNNSGNSIDAPDAYLNINEVVNPLNAFNLQVKVRIDNARCQADIQDANITVSGVTEYSGRCGFLHYTDVSQKVHISFAALQPRNFATFNFSVIKGNATEDPGISEGGYVNSSVGIYTLSGGIYAADVPVSQLLGTCPQAAFSENLNVYSLATDGTRRLHEYDASDINAFALSNT